ncbi:hypothetical protein DL93DRAFT_2056528 [Clavulina sp. PMI_390]|nr:hypothetical protein DL93DRAFT_2056528 [Clavulina sp. PMI_390]
MIGSTKGFLARDWPLHLGWNNLRYILEAALFEADLMDRTLILPSFIYARSCNVAQPACAAFASQQIRSEEIGKGDYFYLPEDEQQTWRLPIGLMVDIPHLRRSHSVITVGEYLRYHNKPPTEERLDGHWDKRYLWIPASETNPVGRNLTEVTLLAKDYEPKEIVRMDALPKGPQADANVETKPIYKAIAAALSDHKTVFLDQAKEIIRSENLGHWNSEQELSDLLRRNGWSIVYTFEGVWLEMMKTVTKNSVEVAPTSHLRGLWDEYGESDADVVFFEGEIHSDTKPGGVRFSSATARSNFASMVLTSVQPMAPVRLLAELLARKMQKLNHGRQYLGAHLRRGDFVAFGWSPAKSIEDHLRLARDRLEDGRKLLDEIWRSQAPPRTVDVPNIEPDTFWNNAPPPKKDDKIFVATDENNSTALAYLRSHNVVLLSDLLEPKLRRVIGWPLLIGDVQAQVEQIVASHAGAFWGYRMSSVSGGIVNMRGARGMDPRTAIVD